eukprot:2586419-Amphidinium_carterae.1
MADPEPGHRTLSKYGIKNLCKCSGVHLEVNFDVVRSLPVRFWPEGGLHLLMYKMHVINHLLRILKLQQCKKHWLFCGVI